MSTKKLENIKTYIDTNALRNNEPGIYHSYIASLATTLNYISMAFDPIWLMGSSGFAFRIFINETLCPSAMSMFSFRDILPESIEQSGFKCIYTERMWHETKKEKEKRMDAHETITEAIERGIPAIVWDVSGGEWGLITGYDDKKEAYFTMTHLGNQSSLSYKKLGNNGINILSASILGDPNSRNREEITMRSLNAAIAHADGKEWIDDRPQYQNGLPAFDLWAIVLDKRALILEAGKSKNIGLDMNSFARYYSGHYYSARCYARDYLKIIAEDNELLQKASSAYGRVADFLKPLWEYFSDTNNTDSQLIKSFVQNIYDAKSSEKEGIALIRKFLN